jgi:hypothetical protein
MNGKVITPLVVLPHRNEKDWIKFQFYLKMAAYINQDTRCLCGYPLNEIIELHHALISKKDIQGFERREIIHSSFNVIAIHGKNCHEHCTRDRAFNFLSEIYSSDRIINWYNQVNSQFKVKLRGIE